MIFRLVADTFTRPLSARCSDRIYRIHRIARGGYHMDLLGPNGLR